MLEINKIYNEPCEETLKKMGDCFLDLTITSPPYDNLRDYNGFSFDVDLIATELLRVTKEGGIVVWIVGDQTINGSETGTSFRHALKFMEKGWFLHDTMIYSKSPSYPANDNSNRYSQAFEYMFIFSKGKPKTYNLLKDRKNRWAGHSSFGTQTERKRNGELKKRKKNIIQEYGYRFNIWNYSTGGNFASPDQEVKDHPATFPELLAKDHIISWSNPGDLVYDCFSGSGTTAKVAHVLDRKFIGSEISKEYWNLGNQRIEKYLKKNLFST